VGPAGGFQGLARSNPWPGWVREGPGGSSRETLTLHKDFSATQQIKYLSRFWQMINVVELGVNPFNGG